jgi:BirA family biotin operon repressor/biotin-[acetyl-CoA-carboxylase] ligase
VVDETGSTNADLTQACRAAPGRTMWRARARSLSADRGRGRQGRPWQGQAGLTFSVAMPLALPPARLSGLSLAVGWPWPKALEDVRRRAGPRVGLKWPNDLQIDGRKLAGILIESVPAGPQRVGRDRHRPEPGARCGHGSGAGPRLAGVAEAMTPFDPQRDPTRILAPC